MKYSIVIPVFRNAGSVPDLLAAIGKLSIDLNRQMEAVFVVDGSPDNSWELLETGTLDAPWPTQLLGHSRNFGSFAAIRSGLAAARGEYCAVMAADLQEPPELVLSFFKGLTAGECDVAIGMREGRGDPLIMRVASRLFWGLYRRTVIRDIPPGGVDIFACNRRFRDELLKLDESRSSLVALVFWLGFRRKFFPYQRRKRLHGSSAWTLAKKIEYMADSMFAFTDYPIRLLIKSGFLGVLAATLLAAVILAWKLAGLIEVPGYAATIIVVLFFGALNLLGLGIVGTYTWRAYENSKGRPLAIVARHIFNGKGGSECCNES